MRTTELNSKQDLSIAAATRLAACLALLMVSCGTLLAQTPIDASLPPAAQPLIERRTLFIFSDIETVESDKPAVARLSAGQKFEMSARSTLDLGTLFIVAATAGGVMATHNAPYYGVGARGYGQTVGAISASVAADSLFTQALLPSVFHQDPRYFQLGPRHSVPARFWYAITRTVVTRSDSGKEMLNFSELGGVAAAVAISNTYYPDSTRYAADNVRRYGTAIAIRMGVNVLREFFTKPKP